MKRGEKENMSLSNLGAQIQEFIGGIIMAVIFLIVGIALGPTVVSAAADINATSMASVTMGSTIVLLADYIPFFYYLGIVLGSLGLIWAYAKYK